MGFLESFFNGLVYAVKLIFLMAPFLAAGFIAAPYLPTFRFSTIVVTWIVAFLFGFFVMVVSHDDFEDPRSARIRHGIGKFLYLVICTVVIAEILRSHFYGPVRLGGGKLLFLSILPLCLIGMKILWSTNIMEYLYEIFKFPSDI